MSHVLLWLTFSFQNLPRVASRSITSQPSLLGTGAHGFEHPMSLTLVPFQFLWNDQKNDVQGEHCYMGW